MIKRFIHTIIMATAFTFQAGNFALANPRFDFETGFHRIDQAILRESARLSAQHDREIKNLSFGDQLNLVFTKRIEIFDAMQDLIFMSCPADNLIIEAFHKIIAYQYYIEFMQRPEIKNRISDQGMQVFAEEGYFDGSMKINDQAFIDRTNRRISHNKCEY